MHDRPQNHAHCFCLCFFVLCFFSCMQARCQTQSSVRAKHHQQTTNKRCTQTQPCMQSAKPTHAYVLLPAPLRQAPQHAICSTRMCGTSLHDNLNYHTATLLRWQAICSTRLHGVCLRVARRFSAVDVKHMLTLQLAWHIRRHCTAGSQRAVVQRQTPRQHGARYICQPWAPPHNANMRLPEATDL